MDNCHSSWQPPREARRKERHDPQAPRGIAQPSWFGVDDIRAFGHRSRMLQAGYAESDFRGKPVIGIINTWSELSPCHFHFRTRARK